MTVCSFGCRGVPDVSRNRPGRARIEPDMAAHQTSLHWPEYLIEAGALGTFMASAAAFAAVLYYPASPAAALVSNELMRRGFMGLAMGATAVAIIYSPWGQRSGAHMNPAVTLTFFRLGKVARRDLIGYILAQFAGAIVVSPGPLPLSAASSRTHRSTTSRRRRERRATRWRSWRRPRSRSC